MAVSQSQVNRLMRGCDAVNSRGVVNTERLVFCVVVYIAGFVHAPNTRDRKFIISAYFTNYCWNIYFHTQIGY